MKSGFTLIELLVVISIIGLLISILLPALGAAKEVATSVKCLSQVKQLGIVTTAYHTDHDELYPAMERWENQQVLGGTLYGRWTQLLVEAGYVTAVEIYHCPDNEMDHLALSEGDLSSLLADPSDNAWRLPSYGVNYENLWGNGPAVLYSQRSRFEPARTVDVAKPSKTISLLDVAVLDFPRVQTTLPDRPNRYTPVVGWYVAYSSWVSGVTNGVIPDARHAGAVNVLWADSHAESVKISDPGHPYVELTSTVFADPLGDPNAELLWDLE